MMRALFSLWAAMSIVVMPAAAVPAQTTGEAAMPPELVAFFDDVGSIRGEFSQMLFDARGELVETSEGEMAIRRPGRFRWHYTTPYEQLIVADGTRLWLYDADLEQVTVREQTGSLSESPAMLLGGETAALDAFRYLGSDSRAGRDWLRLEPAAPDSDFRSVALAFAGGELLMMELADALGQITRIEFSDLEFNQPLDDELFHFEPPAGADVIGADEFGIVAPGTPPD